MKKRITELEFIEAFQKSSRSNNFSTRGLKALFNYFEELEEAAGEEIEFDLIAICCEYTEFASIEELKKDYCIPDNEDVQEWLEDRTCVVCFEEDCILIQNF